MKRSCKTASNLSESIQQHLNMYALAAGAAGVGLVALAQSAEAKIIYTPAHHKLVNGGKLLIDLNDDGVTDFVIAIKSMYWNSMCTFCGQSMSVNGNGNAGAGVIGKNVDAAALRKGRVIGSHDSFQSVQNAGRRMASGFNDNNSFFYVNGQFANKKDRFLGVRFKIRGKVHYGWVRFANVTVTFKNGVAPVVTALLNGFAYEDIAGKSIRAGQTHGKAGDYINEQLGSDAPVTTPVPDTLQAAPLGLLALGARGVPPWRRKETLRGSN